MGFVEIFPSVATLAFVIGSAVVSARLLGLARRTSEVPELLLGGAILCTAVLGYGVLIAGLAIRGAGVLAPDEVPMAAVVLSGAGKLLHDLGVTFFLLFVVYVFRRQTRWAPILASALCALLWGGFAVGASEGSFRGQGIGHAAWYCEYLVIWSYPLWNMIESYRYWGLMRRRATIGLADPLVTNRFLLWGTGSLFTALATWIASLPVLFVDDPARMLELMPSIRIATAATGLVSVTCSLFAFLPPQWYRRRLTAGASLAKPLS